MPEQDPTTPPEETEGMRNLREANDRLKAEADSGKAAQRELAFMRAGVDPESGPVAKLLFSTYDGDLTPDAIKAQATELGIVKGAENNDGPTDEELALQRARDGLGAGDGANTPPPDPSEMPRSKDQIVNDIYATYRSRLENGDDPEAAMQEVVHQFVGQAMDGNPDFVFDAQKWKESAGLLVPNA